MGWRGFFHREAAEDREIEGKIEENTSNVCKTRLVRGSLDCPWSVPWKHLERMGSVT